MPESLWSHIAALPLFVESHAIERLEAPAPAERVTYLVRLQGRGAEGLGEDVGGAMLDEDGAFLAAAPALALAGEWTLATFAAHLADVDLWRQPPEWDMARRWRNWALESAALDLALLQAGIRLPEALGCEPAPLRFVNSLGLGDPPEIGALARRLERYPALRSRSTRRRRGRPSSRPRSPARAPSTSSTSRAATGSPSRTSSRCSRCTRRCSSAST